MDSTAMVGQMISLSQLGQLVSINQTLSSATTTSTGKAVSATDSASAANSAAVAATNSGIAASLSPSAAGAATTQLPFDPNTMMPWNYGNANAAAASINPALNATTLGLTGATNNSIGGK
jgi:flagellar basal-body rod modification protein FlgD